MTPKIEKPSLLKETNVRYSNSSQPAEAEGVELGGEAWMALHLLDRLNVDADDDLRVQQVEEIVRRMGAALSAVTAERDAARDALRAEQDRYQRDVYGLNNEGDPIGGEPAGGYANDNAKLRAEVEAMRKVKTAPALHAAVGAIYFDDSSDFVSALWEVVRSLAPELVDELESNPSAVWHKTEAMAAKEGV